VATGKGAMKERSPGVWWLRVYAGRNDKGNPVQVSKTVHGGVRIAREEMAKLVAQVAERGAPLSGETTLGELLERWGLRPRFARLSWHPCGRLRAVLGLPAKKSLTGVVAAARRAHASRPAHAWRGSRSSQQAGCCSLSCQRHRRDDP
jgi:hypothetical protein